MVTQAGKMVDCRSGAASLLPLAPQARYENAPGATQAGRD
jgi:hypothetical protein